MDKAKRITSQSGQQLSAVLVDMPELLRNYGRTFVTKQKYLCANWPQCEAPMIPVVPKDGPQERRIAAKPHFRVAPGKHHSTICADMLVGTKAVKDRSDAQYVESTAESSRIPTRWRDPSVRQSQVVNKGDPDTDATTGLGGGAANTRGGGVGSAHVSEPECTSLDHLVGHWKQCVSARQVRRFSMPHSDAKTLNALFVDIDNSDLRNIDHDDRRVFFGQISEIRQSASGHKVMLRPNGHQQTVGVWIPDPLEPSGLYRALKQRLGAVAPGTIAIIYALGILRPGSNKRTIEADSSTQLWIEISSRNRPT